MRLPPPPECVYLHMWAMMNVLERVEKRKSAFLYIKKAKITKRSKGEGEKKEKRDKRENTLYCYFQQTGHI